MSRPVVDEGLFAQLSPPRLAGSRCDACGVVVFPRQDACPRCVAGQLVDEALPKRGRVWSWTVQEFEPKPPYRKLGTEFDAYEVGYVDLGDVLIESRLDVPRDRLRIGLPVRLATIPAYRDDDGADVYTFVFVAAEEGA